MLSSRSYRFDSSSSDPIQLWENGRAVGAKPLKEYMEVKGYADAAKWVYSQAHEPDDWSDGDLISVNELRRIHHMALAPVWGEAPHSEASDSEAPGNFREHDIHPFGAGMTPPSWPDVPARVADWIDDVVAMGKIAEERTDLGAPLPEELARLHSSFERDPPVHRPQWPRRSFGPQSDPGTPRLSAADRVPEQREAYLAALQKSDVGDDGPLGEIIARAMLDNLTRFMVPKVAGPARLVPLAALVDTEFTVHATSTGCPTRPPRRPTGTRGIWRSSRRAVEVYKKTKHSRRPTSN